MEQDDLKVGKIVALPSGGPDMTITHITNGVVSVGWFTSAGEYREQNFPVEALVRGKAR